MIVEERGIGFRTGVLFPSGPLDSANPNTFFIKFCFGIVLKLREKDIG